MRLFIAAFTCLLSSVMYGQGVIDTLDYSSYPSQARSEIMSVKVDFEKTDNPFVAIYLGSELHDYFYFPFQGLDGTHYDFAYSNNSLGDIPFGEDDGLLEYDDDGNTIENTSEGAKLVGRKFLITWEYEMSYIVCCEGQNISYPAFLPRISHIEYDTK